MAETERGLCGGACAAELNHALMQLEDHLTDIDMARDFRTLGGWSHLVDMLHGRHHE